MVSAHVCALMAHPLIPARFCTLISHDEGAHVFWRPACAHPSDSSAFLSSAIRVSADTGGRTDGFFNNSPAAHQRKRRFITDLSRLEKNLDRKVFDDFR